MKGSRVNTIQIFHINGNHWIVAAKGKSGKSVQVYDSAHTLLDQASAVLIKDFFHCSLSNIKAVTVQKQQPNNNDCCVYTIANATAFAFGGDPSLIKYDQSAMRFHLIECLTLKNIKPFPSIA